MEFLQPDGSIHPRAMAASPDREVEEIRSLSEEFASKVPSNQYSAAKIQNYLMQYRNDPWSAVKNVTEWTYLQGRHLDH